MKLEVKVVFFNFFNLIFIVIVQEGYLAQLHKTTQKPSFKTYTLKDYRNYKKDALLNVANHTGKLGFDYESDAYKQKVILFFLGKF